MLLHAASASGTAWVYQQPVLAGAGYRVIGYSRRGARNSEYGADAGPGTYAEDLLSLFEHLGLSRAHLVGTAAGSIAAADFALSFPERVRGLVLTCSLITVGDADYLARSSALRPPQWNTLPVDFQELGPSYRAAAPEGVQAWLAQAEGASSAPRQATLAEVTAADLAALRAPILLATGDADLYTPPHMLAVLANRIAHAERLIFRDCGHSAYWESPTDFNAAVLNFLRRHRGPRRT